MILNMRYKGGKGGLVPQLVIYVETGSVVTASNGTTTKTLTETESGVYTADVDFGTWTVTASKNGKTTSEDFVVDKVKQYFGNLDYTFYLYNEGDEIVSRTGGWERITSGYTYSNASWVQNGTNNVFTKGTDSMSMTSYYIYATLIAPHNTIDLTGFSKLYIESKSDGTDKDASPAIALTSGTNLASPSVAINVTHSSLGVYDVLSYPLTGVNATDRLFVWCYSGRKASIKRIWLE